MNEEKKFITGVLSIITAAALWGMSGVIIIPFLGNLPVDYVVFFQYAFPFVIMSIIFYRQFLLIKTFTLIDIIALTLIGLFGGVIGTMAITKALFLVNFSNLSVVVLIQKTQPLFAILLARIFLKEKVARSFYYWVFVVLICVYLMSFGLHLPVLSGKDVMLYAALLSIVSAICFGSNTVVGRYLSSHLSFVSITFYRYAVTSLFALINLIMFSGLTGFRLTTPDDLYVLIILIVAAGPLSMFLYYAGLKNVKASISTICELSLPITAIVLEYLVYGKTLSFVQWLGAIGMIYGIYRITKDQFKLRRS